MRAPYENMPGNAFSIYTVLEQDHFDLAWLIGGALAKVGDSLDTWRAMNSRARVLLEGWHVPEERQDAGKQRHLFIVAAMATEWLQVALDKGAAARALFGAVWAEAHRWSRALVGLVHRSADAALTPLVQIWARLALVRPDDGEELALAVVPTFDSVAALASCASTYAGNLEPKPAGRLSARLRGAVAERFEILRVTWERERRAPEDRERMVQTLTSLIG